MNRTLTLGAGLLLIPLILTGCDTSDAVGPEGLTEEATTSLLRYNPSEWDTNGTDGQVDLIAGQHTKVGVVTITNDADNLYVTYDLDGWCLTEAHVAVDTAPPGEGGFLDVVNPQGKAVPGQFPYPENGELEGCEDTYTVVIPLSSTPYEVGDDLYLAVHGVVFAVDVTEDCNYIYGIAKDQSVYKIFIDPDAVAVGDVTQAFTTTLDNPPANSNWPNGLANDQANGRLYFTNHDDFDNNPLYFINTSDGSQETAGELVRRNADAVFAGGAYWYVTQNERDNLRRATFNADGTIDTDVVACEDFIDDDTENPMEYGDLAFDPETGLIYGNARIDEFANGNSGPDDATATFFSLDPATCEYNAISEDNTFLQQLTFDCAGHLLGQNTSTGNFLLVDTDTGAQTVIGNTTEQFNDLAVGDCACEPTGDSETAWGAGSFFPTNGRDSWGNGLYFQYLDAE